MSESLKNNSSRFLKIAAFLVAYGYTRRMSGGGWPKLPRPISQLLQASPQTALAYLIGNHFAEIHKYEYPVYVGIICAVVTFIPLFWAKLTGMGQYLGIANYPIKFSTPEKIDFIIRPFFGVDPRCVSTKEKADRLNSQPLMVRVLSRAIQDYGVDKLALRNVMGFNALGFVSGLGFSLVLIFVGMPLLSFVCLLLASLQGIVYALCWKYFSYHPTAYAEFFTNVVLGIGVVLVYSAVEGSIF